MNVNLPEFDRALDRVKIGEFVKRGGNIRGVIHVGTNDGYEIQWYLKMGLKVIGFEPLPEAYEKCFRNYAEAIADNQVMLFNYGIGLEDEWKTFYQTDNKERPGEDSGGSSFLKEKQPHEHILIREQRCELKMWRTFLIHNRDRLGLGNYNCLVVDVQGMELDVLMSFGTSLFAMDYLNIECSEVPWYEGEADATQVIHYLRDYGFIPINDISPHDDILFERRRGT